jgi:hypothetical protein
MRAFGYSLPAAIADLVDNSVSADAKRIRVYLHWDGDRSAIEVIDDGHGMDAGRLTTAMQLGSRSPRETRSPGDLGRFGLGLKTAAFSQGTSLTVRSKTVRTSEEARCWDLQHVTGAGSWSLLLDAPNSTDRWAERLREQNSGTQVIIEGLDRLTAGTDPDDEKAKLHFLRQADAVSGHLGMVFHRFISAGLGVELDGLPVDPWDPFLGGSPQVDKRPRERLRLGDSIVTVRPHVLPHYSKMSDEEHRRGGGVRGWNQHQGFYVYREQRLLVAGDWLGLPFQKEEHYKLARIAVDIPNDVDAEWQIDVRKATARIPRELWTEMRRIADATRRLAAEAYRYRGKRLARSAKNQQTFVWAARIHDGAVSYRIDRDHPIVADTLREAGDGRPALERVLRLVEETVPISSIVMDSRDHPDSAKAPFEGRQAEVERMLRDAYDAIVHHGGRPQDAVELLAVREPFDSHPELVAALAEDVIR